jgi:hypothetical protein
MDSYELLCAIARDALAKLPTTTFTRAVFFGPVDGVSYIGGPRVTDCVSFEAVRANCKVCIAADLGLSYLDSCRDRYYDFFSNRGVYHEYWNMVRFPFLRASMRKGLPQDELGKIESFYEAWPVTEWEGGSNGSITPALQHASGLGQRVRQTLSDKLTARYVFEKTIEGAGRFDPVDAEVNCLLATYSHLSSCTQNEIANCLDQPLLWRP